MAKFSHDCKFYNQIFCRYNSTRAAFRLRYAPNGFSSGASVPDPTGGAYSAAPNPLAGSEDRAPGEEREKERRGEGRKREGEGEKRKRGEGDSIYY